MDDRGEETMKPIARTGAATLLLLTLALASGPSFGAENRGSPKPADAGAIAALSGLTAVPTSELGKLRGEGGVSIALTNGSVSSNSVGANSQTGSNTIGANAVTNNTGFTTVFQNSGNNSLFQSSTSIYISVR